MDKWPRLTPHRIIHTKCLRAESVIAVSTLGLEFLHLRIVSVRSVIAIKVEDEPDNLQGVRLNNSTADLTVGRTRNMVNEIAKIHHSVMIEPLYLLPLPATSCSSVKRL